MEFIEFVEFVECIEAGDWETRRDSVGTGDGWRVRWLMVKWLDRGLGLGTGH